MPDHRAEFFDAHVGEFLDRPWTGDEEAKLEWFRARWKIQPGMKVIEPGCGAGQLTKRLATWVGPKGRVLAFDSSPKMVGEHRRAIVSDNVECSLARAEDVALPVGWADRVVCFRVFPHFGDKLKALLNLASAMKEEGLFLVAHFHSRRELSQLHRSAGRPVSRDGIPAEAVARDLFRSAGMSIDELIDAPGRYHLCARLAAASA